jgi:hypothetical protein
MAGARSATVAILGLVLATTATTSAPASSPEPTSAQPAAPVAWVLGSMARLLPTSPPRSATHARLSAARGETEPFQIAVATTHGRLTHVNLHLSALDGPGSAIIPASALVRYREHFIRIGRHSPDNGGPILRRHWFPDALLPFVDPVTGKPPASGARYPTAPFAVENGHTQPLWVDVVIPRDIPAGAYTGRWTVSSDQGSTSGLVTATVRDFTLPVRPAAESSFQIYHARTLVVERLLLRYGVQPIPVDARHETDLVHRGLTSVNLGFWSGAQIDHCTMDPPPSVARLRKAVRQHLGRLHLYNYTADEISRCKNLYPRVRAWARHLHAAGVDQLITMVPVSEVMHDGAGGLGVDIFTLLPVQFRSLDPHLRQAVLDRHGQLWSYQALVQGKRTPSWEIDFPGANYRILPGFLNARMGVTGVLYWTVDYWQHNPWRNIEYTDSGCCFPGEGTLVYPGKPAGDVGVVPTIRLAWIRQGIDDYGYVQLLRDLGHGTLARRIIDRAAHSWSEWTQSPKVLATVRNRLATAIERRQP